MKQFILATAASLCMSMPLFAQENKTTNRDGDTVVDKTIFIGKDGQDGKKGKDGGYVSLGSEGFKVSSKRIDSINKARKVSVHFLTLDIGINALHDKTNYGSAEAQQYLQMGTEKKNGDLFALRQSKSINVNIWPVLLDFRLFKSSNQRISLYTGAGLQLYNFKFNKDISYLNETTPMVIEDSVKFRKNKLAFAYVSIPLMLKFKTRVGGNFWITYGAGVIGGYCFDSWTKQISDERGKQKNHDEFNFQKFNLNLSGEIGINGYIRFYGTYQVTDMYKNGLSQNPYCIGIRFFGV